MSVLRKSGSSNRNTMNSTPLRNLSSNEYNYKTPIGKSIYSTAGKTKTGKNVTTATLPTTLAAKLASALGSTTLPNTASKHTAKGAKSKSNNLLKTVLKTNAKKVAVYKDIESISNPLKSRELQGSEEFEYGPPATHHLLSFMPPEEDHLDLTGIDLIYPKFDDMTDMERDVLAEVGKGFDGATFEFMTADDGGEGELVVDIEPEAGPLEDFSLDFNF